MEKLNKFFFIKKVIAEAIKNNNSDMTITLSGLMGIIQRAEVEFNDAQKDFEKISI